MGAMGIAVALTSAMIAGTISNAAAQDVGDGRVAFQGPYFALGAQAGGEFEICDEDDDCGTGGFGAFGRVGYRANRVLSVEADVGIAAIGGDETFFHAAGLGVATLPVGPVDLRLRAGPALFSADDETRFGVAFGTGIGFRPNDRSAIRTDFLVLHGDEQREGAGFDLGGMLQIGYERRF